MSGVSGPDALTLDDMPQLSVFTLANLIAACLRGEDLSTSDATVPASSLGLGEVRSLELVIENPDDGQRFVITVATLPDPGSVPGRHHRPGSGNVSWVYASDRARVLHAVRHDGRYCDAVCGRVLAPAAVTYSSLPPRRCRRCIAVLVLEQEGPSTSAASPIDAPWPTPDRDT